MIMLLTYLNSKKEQVWRLLVGEAGLEHLESMNVRSPRNLELAFGADVGWRF